MLNLFDRLGFSYIRPTYTLDKVDLKKQEQFRKTYFLSIQMERLSLF